MGVVLKEFKRMGTTISDVEYLRRIIKEIKKKNEVYCRNNVLIGGRDKGCEGSSCTYYLSEFPCIEMFMVIRKLR